MKYINSYQVFESFRQLKSDLSDVILPLNDKGLFVDFVSRDPNSNFGIRYLKVSDIMPNSLGLDISKRVGFQVGFPFDILEVKDDIEFLLNHIKSITNYKEFIWEIKARGGVFRYNNFDSVNWESLSDIEVDNITIVLKK